MMVVLGCDGIQMGLMVYFIVVDILFNYVFLFVDCDNDCVSVSLNELQCVICLWCDEQGVDQVLFENVYKLLFQYVYLFVIGVVDWVELLLLMLCCELFVYYIDDVVQVEVILMVLNGNYLLYSYFILLDEVVKIGLCVECMLVDVNVLLLQFNVCYSEMG